MGLYGEFWGIMGNYGELWGIMGLYGHKGGLLKRTDVHHRLSYIHKFITSVRACAVHSHRLHVSPSWLGCSTIYVHSRDQPQ